MANTSNAKQPGNGKPAGMPAAKTDDELDEDALRQVSGGAEAPEGGDEEGAQTFMLNITRPKTFY